MVATSTASKKSKGRKFQQYVRDKMREKYPQLKTGDIESRGMGQQGTDIILSPAAMELIEWDFEIKRREKWAVHEWWKQAYTNTEEGRRPIVVMKRSREDALVMMTLKDFLEVTK